MKDKANTKVLIEFISPPLPEARKTELTEQFQFVDSKQSKWTPSQI